MSELPEFDPLFHQAVRTRLCIVLNKKAMRFTELKSKLNITDGNLDAHLKKLSVAGFLHSQVVVKGRPYTNYELSPSGRKAFKKYVKALAETIELAAK